MPQEDKQKESAIITPLEDSMGLIIMTLFSLASIYMYYVSGHDYEAILTLIIGTAFTLIYETHRREKVILERSLDKINNILEKNLDKIIEEVKENRKYTNIKRVERDDMYDDAARVVLGAQRCLLIIQRSPTIFFGPRPQGEEFEKHFEEAIKQKITWSEKRGYPEIIYAFSVHDPKFIDEFNELLGDIKDNKENVKKFIDKILKALNNEYQGVHFLPLLPKEFPYPLVVSDRYVAIWLTEIAGTNLYIEFQDKKISRDIFEQYKKKRKEQNKRIRETKQKLIEVIENSARKQGIDPNELLKEFNLK